MKKETKEKVYIVCNSSNEVAPKHILRIYKSKAAAYNFLGRYVSELDKSTYTGYLSIAEKCVGEDDTMRILGDETSGKKSQGAS